MKHQGTSADRTKQISTNYSKKYQVISRFL
jgi:hypothetical protein